MSEIKLRLLLSEEDYSNPMIGLSLAQVQEKLKDEFGKNRVESLPSEPGVNALSFDFSQVLLHLDTIINGGMLLLQIITLILTFRKRTISQIVIIAPDNTKEELDKTLIQELSDNEELFNRLRETPSDEWSDDDIKNIYETIHTNAKMLEELGDNQQAIIEVKYAPPQEK